MMIDHKEELRKLGYDGDFDEASLRDERARLEYRIGMLQQELMAIQVEIITATKDGEVCQ